MFSYLMSDMILSSLWHRQHWFISRMDGASVTAGGFPPQNNNVLIITTSSNRVYAFDVEAKQLGEWSIQHTFVLPRRYQEFPGEVIGLSFPISSSSSTVIVYSARFTPFSFQIWLLVPVGGFRILFYFGGFNFYHTFTVYLKLYLMVVMLYLL